MSVKPNSSPTVNSAEVAVRTSAPASTSSGRATQRKQVEREWLRRLASMPADMYRETIDRLIRGQSCEEVARWILRQPDRGGISDLTSVHVLCRCLAPLAEECAKQQMEQPRPKVGELRGNALPVLSQLLSVPEYVAGRLPVFNRHQHTIALAHSLWETLEHYRLIEESDAQRGLPIQQFADARVRISMAMTNVMAELRKQELADATVQKIMLSDGIGDCPPPDSEGYEPDAYGGRFSATTERPAELTQEKCKPESKSQELNPYASLSEIDRRLVASFTEKVLTAVELERLMQEEKAEQAAAQRAPTWAESEQPVAGQSVKSA